MGSNSPNADYFISIYLRDSMGVYGEIRKMVDTKLRVNGSNDITVPEPLRRLRVLNDNTVITAQPYIQGHVVHKGDTFPIIANNTDNRYHVLLAEGVTGQIYAKDVELLDLETIPLKWAQASRDGVEAYKFIGSQVEEKLSKGSLVRIIEEHGIIYRVLLESGKQSFMYASDLTIVEGTGPFVTHTIASGDTLWKISNKYNVSVADIIKANALTDSNNIIIGQKLIIPTNHQEIPNDSSQDKIFHLVEAGDTLWKIAAKYNTTIDVIIRANNLEINQHLMIGQKLSIPAGSNNDNQSPTDITHIVESGDTLWKISQKYAVTIDALTKTNKISVNDYLIIGQKLVIPKQSIEAEQSHNYVVQAGDSLWKIAQKYSTTVQKIASLNGIDPNDTILVGQELKIPVLSQS